MPAHGSLFAAGAAPSREALRAAQSRLMHDKALQFQFTAAPPEPKVETPGWLKALEQFLATLSHGLAWVFWGGVALAAALLVAFILLEIARTRWPDLLKRKPTPKAAAPADWRPDLAVARALLEEADKLAAEGRYGEAAHLLLYRSIEEIEGRRPRLLRPALTAREIAGLDGVPAAARPMFARIADAVERSFFGGRALDAAGFSECRRAYEAFAFAGAWA